MPDPQIRAFRPTDYPALAALGSLVHPDAPHTAEELEREDRTLPETFRWHRIVATEDGALVGAAIFDQNPGMYHPQVFQVDVMVAPDARGRNIGARLHARILADLEPHRPIRRLGRIRADDPVAAAFVAKRGYRETKRDVLSALDLRRFDPSRWQQVVDDVSAQGISLVTLDDVRGDPARVRAYYDQFSTVRADAPRSQPATPIEFDFFVTEVVEQPDAVSAATVLAFDGERCIGFVQVYASDASDELQTGLTGVDRAYRRRGIATALKARSLAAAKALGAPSIRTDNDARNTGMLAVNDAFGFDRRPGTVTVAWEAESA